MNKETNVNASKITSQVTTNDPGSTGSSPLGVHASVSFGKPDGGGPCLGKGVCHLQSAEPGAIDVNFHLSPLNNELLFILFSMTDLKTNQPDQVAYFTDPSKTYQFDALFKLDNQIFTELGFLPNARISPQSPTEVIIVNDVVITLVKYDHD